MNLCPIIIICSKNFISGRVQTYKVIVYRKKLQIADEENKN